MLEKVKFGTHEFDLVPMGISVDSVKKTRSIRFISNLSYPDIYSVVSEPNNFTVITTIGLDGIPQNTYADSVAFKGMGFDKDIKINDNITADVYTVTHSVDSIERAIATLQAKLDTSQVLSDNAVAELTILIATLYGMLS